MKKVVDEVERRAENFKFTKEACARLAALAEETGKSKTKVVEDYLLGRRQWPEPLQSWLNRQALKKGMDVNEYVKDLILRAFIKDFGGLPQDQARDNGLGGKPESVGGQG